LPKSNDSGNGSGNGEGNASVRPAEGWSKRAMYLFVSTTHSVMANDHKRAWNRLPLHDLLHRRNKKKIVIDHNNSIKQDDAELAEQLKSKPDY
jgi:hypothetical protein